MFDNLTSYILSCEAIKQGESHEDTYELKVAALVDKLHGLDHKISAVLKRAGYLFIHSGDIRPANVHMQEAAEYDADAFMLCQQARPENPIVFKEIRLISSARETQKSNDYLVITEHDIPPLSDQGHLPFWEKDWITPELKALLFGQPDSGEKTEEQASDLIRTYLIVDAHLYTKVKGVFDLPHLKRPEVKCLFTGKAAEDLRLAAPYLVDMTLPECAYEDDDKVPDFHKYYFETQWGRSSGVLVRTAASMDEVHQHFRKFTKVRLDDEKWLFFRFWDASIMTPYLTCIKNGLEHSLSLFNITPTVINSIVTAGLTSSTAVQASLSDSAYPITRGASSFTSHDIEIVQKEIEKHQTKAMLSQLILAYPKISNIDSIPLEDFLSAQISWLHQRGISDKKSILKLLGVTCQYQLSFPCFPIELQNILHESTLTAPAKGRLVSKHAAKTLSQLSA